MRRRLPLNDRRYSIYAGGGKYFSTAEKLRLKHRDKLIQKLGIVNPIVFEGPLAVGTLRWNRYQHQNPMTSLSIEQVNNEAAELRIDVTQSFRNMEGMGPCVITVPRRLHKLLLIIRRAPRYHDATRDLSTCPSRRFVYHFRHAWPGQEWRRHHNLCGRRTVLALEHGGASSRCFIHMGGLSGPV